MNYTKYQLEGKSNPVNLAITVGVVAVLSMFLGWLYNLIFAAPFMLIYFNFIVSIVLGFTIAISLQILSKLLKIRERKTRLILVLLMLLIFLYSHWIAYVLQLAYGTIPSISEFLNYWIYPQNFFATIVDINTNGTWSFGSSNIPVRGVVLTLIWITEAFIIFFLAINYTLKFPENPFSEKQNKWYPKLTLDFHFNSFYSEDLFLKTLKENGIDLILNSDKGLAYKYAEVSVFHLPHENHQYLSINNIFIEVKNKSKKIQHLSLLQ